MKVLYLTEHLSCSKYLSNTLEGFNRYSIEKDKSFMFNNGDLHYLLFLTKGMVKISCKEFSNKVYKEGTMFFLAKENDIKGVALTDASFTLLCFEKHVNVCDKAMLESLYLRQKSINEPTYDGLPINIGIKKVLESVDFYLDNKLSCKHLHQLKLQEIFFVIRAAYTKKEIVNFFKPMLDKTVSFEQFVLANYKKVKTIEELAELYNCSQRTFNRYFQDTFNDSPYNWILKQRSKEIKQILETTKKPFKAIIEEFDFSSPSHFSTFCRSQFGLPPRDIRKQAQKRSKTSDIDE